MANFKKSALGVGGAALLAVSATLGINTVTAPVKAPAPVVQRIPVKASLCEHGKVAVKGARFNGKDVPKGTPCIAIVKKRG